VLETKEGGLLAAHLVSSSGATTASLACCASAGCCAVSESLVVFWCAPAPKCADASKWGGGGENSVE